MYHLPVALHLGVHALYRKLLPHMLRHCSPAAAGGGARLLAASGWARRSLNTHGGLGRSLGGLLRLPLLRLRLLLRGLPVEAQASAATGPLRCQRRRAALQSRPW